MRISSQAAERLEKITSEPSGNEMAVIFGPLFRSKIFHFGTHTRCTNQIVGGWILKCILERQGGMVWTGLAGT
jgi:hypothetical protein